jgi:hypothetical protein
MRECVLTSVCVCVRARARVRACVRACLLCARYCSIKDASALLRLDNLYTESFDIAGTHCPDVKAIL